VLQSPASSYSWAEVVMKVPIVNIGNFPGDPNFVADLGSSYEEFGFCGITGHGISSEVIDDAYAAMREFFALNPDIKEKYRVGSGGARGYTSFGIETAKDSQHPDLKEFWHVGREVPAGVSHHHSLYPNEWPTEVENFQIRLYRLYEAMDELGNRILEALAEYLSLPPGYFRDKAEAGNSVLRPLHYPPIDEHETPSLRAAPHEDINLITLLVGSEEPGLEILSRTGEWIPVSMLPDTIVANIGDMMQRLTNHVLPSTTHRVVNVPEAYTGKSRYSIPFFFHPNPDFEIATLKSCVTSDNPDRYANSITADEYLTERLIEIGLLKDQATNG
jgi:isopenicillin N synthase-like dioxygenase